MTGGPHLGPVPSAASADPAPPPAPAPAPDPATAPAPATVWAVALAAAAAGGAAVALAVPVAPVALLGLAAALCRRPVVLVVATALLGSGLGARAEAGLVPVEPGPFAGVVELVADPRPSGPVGWRAEVRLPDGRRVQASAHGPAGPALGGAHAGGRLDVAGSLRPLAAPSAWTDSRHLVGALTVERAAPTPGGHPLSAPAEAVRGAVAAGARRLPEAVRPLYLGLVIGDDRAQPPAQQVAFRLAGLSHLLAVSGQNVGFALLVAGPVLRRLPTWPRFAAVVGVLVLFATVTRYEPSVVRATACAGLAAWSVALGRPNRGLRILALAVAALVLVDPLLVRSIGFQLSVAASAGILILGPPVGSALPGPRWLREPLAVTVAAQVGVLPLVAATFGPVSVASVPANLAVAAASGLVMTWGLTLGVLAGWAPGGVGAVLQAPAGAALAWIDAVARVAATSGAPRVGVGGLVALVAAWLWWRRAPVGRWAGPLAGVVAVVALAPPADDGPLPGARWCPATGGPTVLVLDAPGPTAALVEALVARGIRRVDVVVATRGSRTVGAAVAQIGELVVLGPVLGPPRHQVRGARRVTGPLELGHGPGRLAVAVVDGDTLSVTGSCGPDPGPVGPTGR